VAPGHTRRIHGSNASPTSGAPLRSATRSGSGPSGQIRPISFRPHGSRDRGNSWSPRRTAFGFLRVVCSLSSCGLRDGCSKPAVRRGFRRRIGPDESGRRRDERRHSSLPRATGRSQIVGIVLCGTTTLFTQPTDFLSQRLHCLLSVCVTKASGRP